MPTPPPFCSLDEVIVDVVPPAGGRGPAPDESEALLALSGTLAAQPAHALQRLVELAMKLTSAASAGLSLEKRDAQGPFFRWIATCGEFARYLNGTMPRESSPCGTTVDARRPLVMRDPARYYAYVSQLHVPIHLALLVPFARGGRFVGTVWVLQHEADKAFSGEHMRSVQGLATFASAVLDAQPPR